jgi:hypothetical protein
MVSNLEMDFEFDLEECMDPDMESVGSIDAPDGIAEAGHQRSRSRARPPGSGQVRAPSPLAAGAGR